MKPLRRYFISALLLCLLAGCNVGDATVYPNTELPYIPEKSTQGANYVVSIVNSDLNWQVYREVSNGMFVNIDEVSVYRQTLDTIYGRLPGYRISAIRPDATRMDLVIPVDNAKLNTPYRILGGGSSSYIVGDYNEYLVDENVSELRFSRIDSFVAAGEFVFRAVNKDNDTVVVRGYFDIPFEK